MVCLGDSHLMQKRGRRNEEIFVGTPACVDVDYYYIRTILGQIIIINKRVKIIARFRNYAGLNMRIFVIYQRKVLFIYTKYNARVGGYNIASREKNNQLIRLLCFMRNLN